MEYKVAFKTQNLRCKSKAVLSAPTEGADQSVLQFEAANDDLAYNYLHSHILPEDTRPLMGRSYIARCRTGRIPRNPGMALLITSNLATSFPQICDKVAAALQPLVDTGDLEIVTLETGVKRYMPHKSTKAGKISETSIVVLSDANNVPESDAQSIEIQGAAAVNQ